MSFILKARKIDLLVLCDELQIVTNNAMKKPELRDLIIKSPGYNEEDVKSLLEGIVSERTQEENRKLQELEIEEKRKLQELEIQEKKRLQDEELAEKQKLHELEQKKLEIEKLRIETQAKLNLNLAENPRVPGNKISKLLQKFETKDDISLYLTLFERQCTRLAIPKELWISYLVGLLPLEITQIIAREPEETSNDYDHIKTLLLKRFQLTDEKFRSLFVSHTKAQDRTWVDYQHEIQGYFDGWTSCLKVKTYENLRNLIIADQMKKKAPFEFKEFYLDEYANITSPSELAEKIEEFENISKTLKPKSFGNNFFKGRNERSDNKVKFDKYEQPNRFENKHTDFNCQGNHSRRRNYYNPSHNSQNHIAKQKKPTDIVEESTNLFQPSSHFHSQGMLQTRNILLGKENVIAVVDTGSSVSLVREDISRKIADRSKLSRSPIILSGIGGSKVSTRGSFEKSFSVDDNEYCLNWHIVPTSKMEFEAVIGSDILEQASLQFTDDGVRFKKDEGEPNKWSMQVLVENPSNCTSPVVSKKKKNQKCLSKTFYNSQFEDKQRSPGTKEATKPVSYVHGKNLSLQNTSSVDQLENFVTDVKSRPVYNFQTRRTYPSTSMTNPKQDISFHQGTVSLANKANLQCEIGQSFEVKRRKTKRKSKKRKKTSENSKSLFLEVEPKTQSNVGLEFIPRNLGPYKAIEIKKIDRYKVGFIGYLKEPNVVTTPTLFT